MSAKRKLAHLLLILIALALLIPGVTQPMLSLTADADKAQFAKTTIDMVTQDNDVRGLLASVSAFMGFNDLQGHVEIFHKTRSIMGTVEDLMRGGNLLVGLLIATFSVIIPTLKLLSQAALLYIKPGEISAALYGFIRAVSKWSMVDVFVVAIIVSYMAGSASGQMGDLIIMNAQLEMGFWLFTGYCLFAIASNQLMPKSQ
ncbi:paraquat-inducible protein A [Shewanella corallii]|uniref:Paraquat-inducible protein A n=2 Tax=Shewanella TaxID=22 RepID=A0ABT0NCY8_9GAMM|nr:MULTISPECIES: paraquat-inducible protein A [Shewanella]MCL1039604.1 paraquat-inducible protein A [Shewanella submarina]MCL2916343.1 paraquat-inducible protein A [Shewanella corallii]